MVAGKKRMGQRERRERVSLYFSTSYFFHVSVLDVKGGSRYTLVVCSIKSGCESHSWYFIFIFIFFYAMLYNTVSS